MGEDMYNLLAKHFSGQATEEETATVNKWIEADKANEADYRLLEKLWQTSNEQEPITFDTEKALQSVTAQIDAAEPTHKKARVFSLQRAVAVAAMLLITLTIWWIAGNNNKVNVVQALTNVKEVQLQDGSKIYLRKGSVLQYPDRFEGNKRAVTLTGEAFFEITHDTRKPFIIAARKTEVMVVGTSFSVIAGIDSVEVIVKTGKVAFSYIENKHINTFVTAGERALYSHEHLTKGINTDENFNAWQSKQLVFKNASLAYVIATISDYYKVQIDCNKIDLPEMANTTVTMSFNDQTLTSVLHELSLITPYEAKQISNNHFELIKK
jgi:ferric-dicitrate binding protein FerR (iron transport regulator)